MRSSRTGRRTRPSCPIGPQAQPPTRPRTRTSSPRRASSGQMCAEPAPAAFGRSPGRQAELTTAGTDADPLTEQAERAGPSGPALLIYATGARGGNRTPDLDVRTVLLYP